MNMNCFCELVLQLFQFWKALDPLTAQDNVQVKKIHICKMRKKQEVEKIRKLKKIKWLKQM